MRASATALTRKGIGVKLGTLTHPFSPYHYDLRNVGFQGTRHFSSMLRVDFSCLNDIHFARFLFREMMRVRPRPCNSMFNKLLNAVVKMEEYTTALYMFDEMRQLGAPIDLCTMNIAINFYCLLKRVNFGFAMLGCIFKLGYEPNAVTFTTLVKGLCLNDKVIEAENLFLNLLAHNLSVTDEVMISTLINGLCKGGWTSRACDLLEFLERTSCKPNAYAYNALMDGYCSQGRIDKVKGIFRSIVEQGLEPNMFTYAILIKGCFKKGKVDEAWCIFHEVSRKGLQHTTVTYNTMLHGLVCAGRFSEGWKLFSDMKAQQVRPDIITYGILVKGLCADGRVAAARDLLHQLPSKGLRPDVRMYTTIIASLHRKGLIEEGKRLPKEMKENGLRRDETLERLIRERDEL